MSAFGRTAAILLLLVIGADRGRTTDEVLVSAAVSLTDVMTTVAHAFQRSTGVHVSVNVGSSNTLARQIVNGAPADVFVSADAGQMDLVERAGRLVAGSRVDWLSNQLAVVVAAELRAPVRTLADLAKPEIQRIAIGDPAAVPAGVYAKQLLEARRLWTSLQPRLVPSPNVRAALAAVESGNASAAIVYVTDARTARRANIALVVPRAEGPRIVYPIALIQRAGASPRAAEFHRYLLSDAGREAARQAGFVPLDPSTPSASGRQPLLARRAWVSLGCILAAPQRTTAWERF